VEIFSRKFRNSGTMVASLEAHQDPFRQKMECRNPSSRRSPGPTSFKLDAAGAVFEVRQIPLFRSTLYTVNDAEAARAERERATASATARNVFVNAHTKRVFVWRE
jgi:hypothetical protein